MLRRFRDAIARAGGGRIIVADTEPTSAASLWADVAYEVPLCSDGRFAPAIAEIVERERIDAVLPLRCAAVATAPALRALIGDRLICGSDDAADVCTDKVRTSQLFETLGVRTPQLYDDPQPDDLPLFFRRRMSEGSVGARAVATAAELEWQRQHDTGIFTTLVRGREFTMDLYKDLRGNLVSCVARERLRVRAGEVERAVIVNAPELCAMGSQVAGALQFVGPATVQAILQDDIYHFTEVNLRYGGGVTLSLQGGAPSHEWLVQELAGHGSPAFGEPDYGLAMSRYDEDLYFRHSAAAP